MSKIPIPLIGDTLDFIKRVFAEPDRSHITETMHDYFGYEPPKSIGMFWPHGFEIILVDPDYL